MSFRFRVAAAPVAGISNRTYRDIVYDMGADLAYSEMVSAQALVYGNKKTLELLDLAGSRGPAMVQLFGSDPAYMAKAAVIARDLGAEYIDINMGCPVPKVVRNGEGSALMRDQERAAELVAAARDCGLPVSVKIRAGWDEDNCNAPRFAQRMEQAGAWLVAVHGRTRQQFYSGKADRQLIARVKQAVSIPVLANGDIFSAEDALFMMEYTGCDGIMVGRGMLGNPWIFREIKAALAGCHVPSRPEPPQIVEQALAHLHQHIRRSVIWYCRREGDDSPAVRLQGEKLACHAMRNPLGYYVKGLRDAAGLRAAINTLSSYDEIKDLLNNYLLSRGYGVNP